MLPIWLCLRGKRQLCVSNSEQ
ncbi:unnamed protein product [Acanthoscelides obtectus]|uniref:Uncharacterized protein n=1 Tax=Acanthoscelides obtectus TaxID=200917 RepID=A0A9P0Q4Q4_ACAOB|nr:unnamed protein product [Acanthoscelides obtectus]CAK1628369.1 hypothetical protein AOBTE_LOCUS5156 [Acanthoscelides obtectus]